MSHLLTAAASVIVVLAILAFQPPQGIKTMGLAPDSPFGVTTATSVSPSFEHDGLEATRLDARIMGSVADLFLAPFIEAEGAEREERVKHFKCFEFFVPILRKEVQHTRNRASCQMLPAGAG